MYLDFFLTVLSSVLVSLICFIMYGGINLLKRINKLNNDSEVFQAEINGKLNSIFTTTEVHTEALSAIILFIEHGIKNGDLSRAKEGLKTITFKKQ